VKQPVLVLGFVAAAWLLVQPFLHWLVRWQIDGMRFAIECMVAAIFALLAGHAVRGNFAAWAAIFAALTVALNPFWPVAAPERASAIMALVAGVSAALYGARRWQ